MKVIQVQSKHDIDGALSLLKQDLPEGGLTIAILRTSVPGLEPGQIATLDHAVEGAVKCLLDYRSDSWDESHTGSILVGAQSRRFLTQEEAVAAGVELPADLSPDNMPDLIEGSNSGFEAHWAKEDKADKFEVGIEGGWEAVLSLPSAQHWLRQSGFGVPDAEQN